MQYTIVIFSAYSKQFFQHLFLSNIRQKINSQTLKQPVKQRSKKNSTLFSKKLSQELANKLSQELAKERVKKHWQQWQSFDPVHLSLVIHSILILIVSFLIKSAKLFVYISSSYLQKYAFVKDVQCSN